jgi:EPS-associated MarR family transcriptional regulator
MSGARDRIRQDARFRLLRLLEQNPEISQRNLAASVGISTSSAHYLLSAFVKAGRVKMMNFSASQDKRRYAYVLTPRGLSEKTTLTRKFLRRKRDEYEALREEIAALERETRMSYGTHER